MGILASLVKSRAPRHLAVNVTPGDGRAAEEEMIRLGAAPVTIKDLGS